MTTYTLAGGCFWCIDAVFRHLRGVETSVAGYVGGRAADATYGQVSTGRTDHTEAVQVTFDESVLPGGVLLDIFFASHDPTTPDRQGADIGRQYRSMMFYADEAQHSLFRSAIGRAQTLHDNPIVTDLTPFDHFYPAEPEHQDYFSNNPERGYCSVVISPKVARLRQRYTQYLK